jgi:hypothetical protein
MNLMMDIIEYVRLDHIRHTRYGFAAAVHEFRGVFHRDPFELRVGRDVMRNLMRDLDEYGPAIRPDHEGRLAIAGVAIKLLPESYEDDAIMAIHRAETHSVPPRRPS